jgi:hypothetical protein
MKLMALPATIAVITMTVSNSTKENPRRILANGFGAKKVDFCKNWGTGDGIIIEIYAISSIQGLLTAQNAIFVNKNASTVIFGGR